MKQSKFKSVVFISNYFNHHQKPVSESFFRILGDGYSFIETGRIREERLKLGWGEDIYPDYVIKYEEFLSSKETYLSLINDADVVVIGSAPFSLIENRIKEQKITFRYSERLLKSKHERWKDIIRFFTWRKHNPQGKSLRVLCSSAYTAADFSKYHLYKNRFYKWGYFPEFKTYKKPAELLSSKKKASILWAARLIDWKHPELAVEVADRLRNEGYDFELNIIGSGELEEQLKSQIASLNLVDYVKMLGSMKPYQVREYMEHSRIFLFTSDRNEGWGAVLNESMNSCCAVVANHIIGSVPFLIDNGYNGIIYKDGNFNDLYSKIKWLLDNPFEQEKIGLRAYNTIANHWNADVAVKRLLELSEHLVNNSEPFDLFTDGPCSKAEIIKD